MDDNLVKLWWAALCLLGLFNIGLWVRLAVVCARESRALSIDVRRFRKTQLLLAGVFVLGCASRCFVPRADVQRICLVDSWVSTVFVGRSIATVAELCLMAQCSLLLYVLAKSAGSRPALVIAKLIVPVIAVAEAFSWYSVVTTNYLGNTVEESLWALCELLLVAAFAGLWRSYSPRLRSFMRGGIAFGVFYVGFMCAIDVPMYYRRWRADEASGRSYFDLSSGFHDLTHRWVVTFQRSDWNGEMLWMLIYFGAAVWLSLAIIRAPLTAD